MVKYHLTREEQKSLEKGEENDYDTENDCWRVTWKDCLAQEEKA